MKSKPLVITSLFVAVAMVATVMIYTISARKHSASNTLGVETKTFNAAQLQDFDGKDGHKCYVAVDGKVYDLSGAYNWENGQHVTSEGQAYCGADMSQVIDKSPHGRKILDQLNVVGEYKP